MPKLPRLLLTTALALALTLPVQAQERGNSGAYLAARVAASEADFRAAAD